MIGTAEVVAKRYGISRERQDAYALQSQQRTAAAQAEGRYKDEIVPVTATMLVKDKATGVTKTLKETHRMRYLFRPEVELAFKTAGMKLIDSRAWMSDDPPSIDSWGAVFVGKG